MSEAVRNPANEKVALTLLGLVLGMTGLAFASVPLYDLFCRVTGYGGTTQVASEAPMGLIDRQMTVKFDSNVDRALPWQVVAARPVTDQVGATETVVFRATNTSNKPVSGTALFNVVPEKAGMYFNKMECFCFTAQTLQPGETVEMPIVFFVDPALDDDKDLDTIREITLSYTFYASDNEGS